MARRMVAMLGALLTVGAATWLPGGAAAADDLGADSPDADGLVADTDGRADGRHGRDPLVIGHRGASGYRPRTDAAYELAIAQCADYIEPDLVSTAVADHPEFADRRTTKVIDGVSISGWFTEDFTFAELQTLRAKERIPAVRPANTAYDGQFPIPSLQEVIDLAQRSRTCDGRRVGIYPETKHPSYFDGIGLSMEEELVRVLHDNHYRGRGAPVFIQSFEVGNLVELDGMTRVRLVQLINCSGQPWDFTVAGDPRTYADLVTRDGLRFVDDYADGIGVCKNVLIPRDAGGNLTTPSAVIADAHRRGLVVHGWTFRRENQFLPTQYRSGSDPNAPGDMVGEARVFLAAGMDGFFTDNPDLGVLAT